MPDGNEIYNFLKQNGLTTKDPNSFMQEYSDPQKAQQLYSFFKENNLTTKDSSAFYDTYFKPSDFAGAKQQTNTLPINNVQYAQPVNRSNQNKTQPLPPQPKEAETTDDEWTDEKFKQEGALAYLMRDKNKPTPISQPIDIGSFQATQQQPYSNLGVDVGMQPVNVKAIKEQEKKTARQAAINTAHRHFENNKFTLKELSKSNDKLSLKNLEGKPIEGQYSLKHLEKASIFDKKVAEVLNAYERGDLALTHYQKGEKVGEPIFTRPEGFLGSLGNSIKESFKLTKDAIASMNKNPEELADYFDQQKREIPEVAESVPVGAGSYVGGALGGVIKPAAEAALGAAITAESGGWGALAFPALDIIPSTTTAKTKEIYFDRMAALESKYGEGNVPDELRKDAITKAMQQAPLQAIPEEAMQLYLFGKGASGANGAAIQSFKKTLGKSGLDIGKMAVLGGAEELATQGIKELQGGEGKFGENVSAAAGNWALMEGMFRAMAIGSKIPKHILSSGKNMLATAEPEVVQKLSDEAVKQGWVTKQQAESTLADVKEFSEIKQTIPSHLSEEKQASIAGLLQKNKALEEQKKTQDEVFHDDLNAEIENNKEKIKQILNSSNPLRYETDNLTGDRVTEKDGITVIMPKQNEKAQTEKPIEEGTTGSKPIDELNTSNESSKEQENVGETLEAKRELSNIELGLTDRQRILIADIDSKTATVGNAAKGDTVTKIELTSEEFKEVKNQFKKYNLDAITTAEFNEWRKDFSDRVLNRRKNEIINKWEVANQKTETSVTETVQPTAQENLINDISKIPLEGVQAIAYKGKPEKLLGYIQREATGLKEDGTIKEHAWDAAVKLAGGNEDLVKRAVEALPEDVKQKIIENIKDKENIPNGLKEALGISEPKKIEQDAISIEKPTEMDVRQQTGDGEGMGEGNAEHKIITTEKESKGDSEKEKVDIHVEYPPTQLSHSGTEKLRTEFDGEAATKKEKESFLETERQADEAIREGYDVNGLLDKMDKDLHNPSPKEQFILTKHADLLANQLREIGKTKGIDSPEFDAKLNELDRVSKLSDLAGSRQGKELGSRRFKTINDDSLVGYLLQEKELNKGADLTEQQKTTAINEYEKINKANDEFDAKYEKLQEDYAKLLAEREVKKQASTTKKNTKKTHEDFVKERKSFRDEFKAAGEKHKQELKEKGIHTAGVGGLTLEQAKVIGKIVTSYLEEGVSKLDDIVAKVFDDLDKEVPEREIRNAIAGIYNEPKKTRNQVAEQRMNLKIQQNLLDKYEKMIKGEQPKTEKAKIKFNQEIHDLRQKIKWLEKEEKEANKFYGESDSGNKRIEKLEDELQRLKDRKPKAVTPKEKREISDREKELKEQIAEERKTIKAEEKEANTRYKEEIDEEVKRLNRIKKRNETELSKIQEQLKSGDFEEPNKKIPLSQDIELKKQFPNAYKEALDSYDKLVKAKLERRKRIAIQQFENMGATEKTLKNLTRWLNVPRSLMASGDLSALLRQGIVAAAAHPKLTFGVKFENGKLHANGAFWQMFSHIGEKQYDRYFEELKDHPLYETMKESKLALTDPNEFNIGKEEEVFLGGNIAQKIPLLGKLVGGSERAYTYLLNKIRIDLFDMYANALLSDGKTFQNSPELYKGFAKFINNATGRGTMKVGESAAPVLNSILFAPRLIAARLNMLGLTDIPNLVVRGATLGKKGVDFGFYTSLPKEVRVKAMGDMLKTIALGTTILGIYKHLLGAEVEDDPRSSDFGKIKYGNTRWDIWGGFQPYVRLFTQLATGQRKTAQGIKDIDKQFGQSRWDVLLSFGRGKLAPIWGMGADVLANRTIGGEKVNKEFGMPNFITGTKDVNFTDEMIQHLFPLIAQDIYDAMKDRGVSALYTVGLPTMFGIGAQTYEPRVSIKTESGRPQRPRREHREAVQ